MIAKPNVANKGLQPAAEVARRDLEAFSGFRYLTAANK
jgi:hypothetical protein